jgi:hypothetical protein
MTQQERTRIFLMYYGSPLIVNQKFEIYEGTTYEQDHIFDYSRIGIPDRISSGRDSEVALYLKDIEDISNEDAIEVARLNDVHTDNPILVSKSLMHWLKKEGYCRDINYVIADYLREKGYALPYKGQSLFELGIAIRQKV